jgi:ankyrin repeat protein
VECKTSDLITCYMLRVNRFRWAFCQLDALEKCLDPSRLQIALKSLPKTLDETYVRILRRIPEEYKRNAIRLLQFLTYSERPLTIEEAVDAIAVETEGGQYFDPAFRMPNPQEISRYCSSLVVLVSAEDDHYDQYNQDDGDQYNQDDSDQYSQDDSDQYNQDDSDDSDDPHYQNDKTVMLQLAHFSVKEYLISNRLDNDISQDFHEINAKASMATVCLAYLLQLNNRLPVQEIRQRFPLAQYSAEFWITFAAVAERKDETLQVFIKKFFYNYSGSYRNCYSLYRPDMPWTYNPTQEPGSALYYASFGGLMNTVVYLISSGADINAQGGLYRTALAAASVSGHKEIVEQLINSGADVNAQGEGEYGGTALAAASGIGHKEIVELLISSGADVNAQGEGEYGGTALVAASESGHKEIVELLISSGADVNAQVDQYGGTALAAASNNGHKEIVELLISSGADVNAQEGGYYGSTALVAASLTGHKEIVELLISSGADVNARGEEHYGTALAAASNNGHKEIVEQLISSGADVNARGEEYYGTALLAASHKGHNEIIKLLISSGADVNARGGHHGTALVAASVRHDKEIVELLISSGADVNAQVGDHTALTEASWNGYEDIVELLRSNGAMEEIGGINIMRSWW